MSSLDVDWVQSLSDGDTDRNTSEKRVIKSVERTINYLDELLEEKEKHEVSFLFCHLSEASPFLSDVTYKQRLVSNLFNEVTH